MSASKNINAEKIQGNLGVVSISASTISLSSLSSTTSATTFNDIVIDSNGNVLNNNLFDISINFIDIETWNYRAPEDFKIYNIINPDGLNLTIDVNSSGYTTGDTIVYLDTVEITPDATGFIKLNCEKL